MVNNVTTVSEDLFKVNGKPVYLDGNNKWIAKHLNSSEMETAISHIRGLEAPKNSK